MTLDGFGDLAATRMAPVLHGHHGSKGEIGMARSEEPPPDGRRFEEMLRSVVNNVVDGIITIDQRGAVESFNPAAEKLFGYEAAEIIGRNVKVLMPEPYQGEHDEYIANYLRTGQAKIIGIGREVVGRRRDGSTFPMDLAVSEFTLGPRRFFTGIVRDITQRKRNENELRDIAAQLSESNRRKTEFLAILAPIRTGLEIMKQTKDNPALLERVRETMERQTKQLITLVDDLLDVSRITRGKLELRKGRVQLSDVVQSVVEASQPLIDEAGHELTVEVPQEPISLDADPHRLAQVLSNLLNNAARYTPEGGRIRLRAERRGDELIASVKDNGVGIPPEMRECIFEMFAQIDRPMEKGWGGLGIGLTLVKSLVEMHGGTVEVHSEGVNQGSEFVIRLPVREPPPVEEFRMPDTAVNTPSTGRYRVLVVDDNQAAAEMLRIMVQALGNEVRVAYDGQEAVAAAADFMPDIVVMDIGMPRMNGYEAARHIRKQPWGRKMLLIALTGWGQDEDKRRTQEAGFDHHLVKPAEPAELQQLLAPARP
jgi:PAS domain S-box-containing protein